MLPVLRRSLTFQVECPDDELSDGSITSTMHAQVPAAEVRSCEPSVSDADVVTIADGIDYVREGGFRHVRPYLKVQSTTVKGRWESGTLLDALCADFGATFGAAARSSFSRCIAAGLVSVDGTVERDEAVPLRSRKCLSMLVHRHEPPIVDAPLHVERVGEYFVVDKPGSWPVYPCGPHAKNSVTAVLEAEHGVRDTEADLPTSSLHLLFRLDRLVSGLLVFATSRAAAARWMESAESGALSKIYVARVSGRLCVASLVKAATDAGDCSISSLPSLPSWSAFLDSWRLTGSRDARISAFAGRQWWSAAELTLGERSDAGEGPTVLEISRPIARLRMDGRVVSTAVTAATDARAKASSTLVAPVAYDETTDSSAILIRAVSGRTHQLRVHLQSLGHSILNDTVYGGVKVDCEVLPNIAAPRELAWLRASARADPVGSCDTEAQARTVAMDVCRFCAELRQNQKEEGPTYPSRIYLHALSYAGDGGFTFGAALPSWW